MEHTYRKGRAGAKAGTGGKIRLIIQTNLLHIQHFHRLPDSRVLDFLKRRDPFRLGVGKLGAIVKKRRQMPDIYITVFVKGGGKHRSAMLLEIFFHIGAATEKGHSKGGFGNNHVCSLWKIDVAVRMRGIALLCTRRVAYKLLHILACNFAFTV